MQKLKEVEEAKTVMTQAISWSVMRWLAEKKKVRRIADVANAALDDLNQKVKSNWGDDLRAAYDEINRSNGVPPSSANGEAYQLAKKVWHADGESKRAHDEAEATFDEAERQLSTSMAREGCHQAIRSWELHEKAIDLAESGVRSGRAKA